MTLAAYNPFKKLLYQWLWKIKTNQQLLNDAFSIVGTANTSLTEDDSSFQLKGGDVTVVISKKDGQISGVKNSASNAISFSKGPLFTDGNTTITAINNFKEGNAQAIEIKYS